MQHPSRCLPCPCLQQGPAFRAPDTMDKVKQFNCTDASGVCHASCFTSTFRTRHNAVRVATAPARWTALRAVSRVYHGSELSQCTEPCGLHRVNTAREPFVLHCICWRLCHACSAAFWVEQTHIAALRFKSHAAGSLLNAAIYALLLNAFAMLMYAGPPAWRLHAPTRAARQAGESQSR